MKKRVLSVISFIVVFSLLFGLFQHLLHKRWDDLYLRNKEYIQLSDDDVDILCFGTSELFAAYVPVVTYHEQGMTGYNFAIPYHSAITPYYQLCQALEYHTPKVVICEFCSLYEDNLPTESTKIETLYAQVLDCLKDPRLKFKMIYELAKLDDERPFISSFVSWTFPLLRYHSMWNELGSQNFMTDDEVSGEIEAYRKGARLQSTYQYDTLYKVTPESWNYEEEINDFSEISVEYYDKFIEKCQENDITVVAVFPPQLDLASEYAAKLSSEVAYFSSKGVYCLNYNTYEQVERLGLDLETDYYDTKHLNTLGSVKFSKVFADDMKMFFGLPDRREDENVSKVWDEAYKEFEAAMLTSQPTVRHTVELAKELGYDAVLEISSESNNIASAEMLKLNRRYGSEDELKCGYYVYNSEQGLVEHFDCEDTGKEKFASSIGEITRVTGEDEYTLETYIDGKGPILKSNTTWEKYVSPRFGTNLAIIDKDKNIYSKSYWNYYPDFGNSSLESME